MKEGKKVKKAREFAIKAHEGQKRKFTFAPYIVHPASVAQKVLMSPYADENMVCAAWLHDIVEDCAGYTIGTIRREF